MTFHDRYGYYDQNQGGMDETTPVDSHETCIIDSGVLYSVHHRH